MFYRIVGHITCWYGKGPGSMPNTFKCFYGACPQNSKVILNDIDAEEPEISDLKLLPDTQSLAEKIKGCLQVSRRA